MVCRGAANAQHLKRRTGEKLVSTWCFCLHRVCLGLCSCSKVKPKEYQVCSYKCIFFKKRRLENTSREKLQKQETGDQNSDDLSAILHFFHQNIEHIFSPTLCFDCSEPPVVGMAKRTRGTFWFLASRLRLRPGFNFMVSIVPGCPNAARLSLMTCFILKSNPVLVSGHCPFPHLSPTWLSSLFPPAPPCVTIVCVFLCPMPESLSSTPDFVLVSCHCYVCSCSHHPFCLWLGILFLSSVILFQSHRSPWFSLPLLFVSFGSDNYFEDKVAQNFAAPPFWSNVFYFGYCW